MLILEYFSNFSPQIIYHHILKRLNKAVLIIADCHVIKTKSGLRICFEPWSVKPCNLQGRTGSSQRKLDKSWLVQHLVVPAG